STSSSRYPPLLTTTHAAKYCGFKTTSALRKAHLEGKIFPAGRRGGRGTWMWRRVDLDAFLCGRRGGNLSDGRSSAPPIGGSHGQTEVDSKVELMDRAQTGEAGGVAQEGGRLPGAGENRRPADRKAERDSLRRRYDRRFRGLRTASRGA